MQNRCGGGDFLRAGVNGQARLFALTPLSPSPARRERGNAQQDALPCAPTPLSHSVGEGLGVRAKKRARPAHSELKRCILIRTLSPLDKGLKGVGFLRACLLAALPSSASLPSCERDARAPSTRDAGNAGVSPALPTAREKTTPLRERAGSGGILHAQEFVNSGSAIGTSHPTGRPPRSPHPPP